MNCPICEQEMQNITPSNEGYSEFTEVNQDGFPVELIFNKTFTYQCNECSIIVKHSKNIRFIRG